MPIVDAPLIASVRAKIDDEFGPAPAGIDVDVYRNKLARIVAHAAQYVRDNAQVNSGIHVTVSTSTGIGATDQPGTIS